MATNRQTVEPEPWSKGSVDSKAKKYLKMNLEGTDNWIQRLIAADPKVSSKTIDRIRDSHELFQPYKKEKFRANFRRMKKAIEKHNTAVAFDQAAFEKELLKYPNESKLKTGCPRWNHSDNAARKLLETDLKPGGLYSNEMKPSELQALRPEYGAFSADKFRDRIYREQRKQKEDLFWVHKRNRKMKESSVDTEIQALMMREREETTHDTQGPQVMNI